MSLATAVYDTTQQPTCNVYIGGVLMTVLSVRGQESYDSPVPTVDLELAAIPSWVQRGQSVIINAGYGNDTIRAFTGGVLARGDEDPDFLRTQCFVTGATDAAGAQIAATASLIGGPPVWPPIPSGNYIDFSVDNHLIWDSAKASSVAARELTRRARIPQRPSGPLLGRVVRCAGDLYGAFRSYQIPAHDYSGQTVKTAIETVLAASGISAYDTAGVPAYTLAGSGATVDRMPGSQQLAKLMGIDGCAVQQLRSSVVLVKVIDFQPAPSANFIYSTTVQAYARIIDATGELEVPYNPLLQIGQTIQVDIDYLGITGRWFLHGHRWENGRDGAWSYLDLRGGPEYGGTVGINPIADFTFVVEQEVIGDRIYTVVTFDASTAHDPDGSIASYAWTDNQTPHLVSGSGVVVTVTVDPTAVVGDWEVTLTVTDNTGLTGSITKTVPVSATSSAVQLPAIYVAMGNNQSASPDGGVTWNDQSGTNVISVGARPADGVNFGHCCFGRSDGTIWRTLDGCQTAPTQVATGLGSAVNDVLWDWRDPTNVWAITENGRVYRSQDAGATFVLYAQLRAVIFLDGTTAVGALGNKLGCPAGGGIWIFGGDGAGRPLIAYDAALTGQWTRQPISGDLATDTPGTATLRIADYTAPGDGHSTLILTNASGGGVSLVAIYDSTTVPGVGAFTRATGLTAGLSDGHVILNDTPLAGLLRYAIFNDRDVWKATDCLAYTKTANVLPAGVTCNHGLFMSDLLTGMPEFMGIFLLACQNAGGTLGIYKSTDGLQTVGALRPATGFPAWPAGAQAKKISIGAAGQVATGPTTPYMLIRDGANTDRRLVKLEGTVWSTVKSGMPDAFWGLRYWGSGRFTHLIDGGLPQYSGDHGANWAAATAPVGVLFGPYVDCMGIDKSDFSNRLWSTWKDGSNNDLSKTVHYCIAFSDDWGATWTLSLEENTTDSGYYRTFWAIACHPTDPNYVFTVGRKYASYIAGRCSSNGGATWDLYTGPFGNQAGAPVSIPQKLCLWASAGHRMIVGHWNNTESDLSYSDNLGTSWTTVIPATNQLYTHYELLRCGLTGPLYLVYNSTADSWPSPVWRSFDHAASWEEVVPPTSWVRSVASQYSAAYSPAQACLWLARSTSGGAGGKTIYSFEDIFTGGSADWVDRQYNLTTIGAGMTRPVVQGLQIVWDEP